MSLSSRPPSVKRVVLAPHDARWPEQFVREVEALSRALGPRLRAVHHIGSTAVAGLVAKPIIDVLVVVDAVENVDVASGALAREGYENRGENGIEGRRYLVRAASDAPMGELAHVHCFAEGHPAIAEHLAFRDRLVERPDLVGEYAALKERLATQHPDDRAAYTAGKTDFIRRVLRGS